MRVNLKNLLFNFDLFDFRNIYLLTGSAPYRHLFMIHDHITAAYVPAPVNYIPELFLKAQPDFTGLIHGEPLTQTHSLSGHILELDQFHRELHFLIFGTYPAQAHNDVLHMLMGEDKPSYQIYQVLFHGVKDLHFYDRLVESD